MGGKMLKRCSKGFMLVLLAFCAAGAAHAQQMVVTTIAHDPFTEIAERVMQEAYRRLGLGLKVVAMPGMRAVQEANAGEFDGDLCRKEGLGASYPNLLAVPVVIAVAEVVAFGKDKNMRIDGWNSLRPYTIGYLRGIKVVEMSLPAGTRTEPVASYEQIFQKVQVGRTDLAVVARVSGMAALRSAGITDVYPLERPLVSVPLYHYLHVKHRHLLEPLTIALRQMEREGAIRAIQKQVEAEVRSEPK